MSLQFILIIAMIIAGFIIWNKWYARRTAEKNRVDRISDESQQRESLRLEERQKLRAEEKATKDKEERKVRAGQEADLIKIKEERDSQEKELRQKIADRKKDEAEKQGGQV